MTKYLRTTYIFFFLLALGIAGGACSRSTKLSFRPGRVTLAKADSLQYYLARKSEKELQKKLLVFIQGSGNDSIKNYFGYGTEAAQLGFDILYLEKYRFNVDSAFRRTDTRERRVNDITKAVRHVIDNEYKGELEELAIIADSEGGVIAPEIATKIPETSFVLIIGAGGMTQERELHTLLRQNSTGARVFFKRAGISDPSQLKTQFEDIYADPSPKRFWMGHSYAYWNSYLPYSPEEHLRKLTMPVMYIIGERDEIVPVESVTYLKEKFADKKNFSFHVVADADHRFVNSKGKQLMPVVIRTYVLPEYRKLKRKA